MKRLTTLLVFTLTTFSCASYESPSRRNSSASKEQPISEARETVDAQITYRIRNQLMTAGLTGIEVTTNGQVVLLCGYVDSNEEKALAEEIAKRDLEVTTVNNQLVVGKKPPVNTNKPGGPQRGPCSSS